VVDEHAKGLPCAPVTLVAFAVVDPYRDKGRVWIRWSDGVCTFVDSTSAAWRQPAERDHGEPGEPPEGLRWRSWEEVGALLAEYAKFSPDPPTLGSAP
jgi:hypothetical protein